MGGDPCNGHRAERFAVNNFLLGEGGVPGPLPHDGAPLTPPTPPPLAGPHAQEAPPLPPGPNGL